MSIIGNSSENLTLQSSGTILLNSSGITRIFSGSAGFSSRVAHLYCGGQSFSAGYPVGIYSTNGLVPVYSTNSTYSASFIGIALADSAYTQYIPVALPGAYVSLYSGLQTGAAYYAGSTAGQITTTASGKIIGIAVNPTTLMVYNP